MATRSPSVVPGNRRFGHREQMALKTGHWIRMGLLWGALEMVLVGCGGAKNRDPYTKDGSSSGEEAQVLGSAPADSGGSLDFSNWGLTLVKSIGGGIGGMLAEAVLGWLFPSDDMDLKTLLEQSKGHMTSEANRIINQTYRFERLGKIEQDMSELLTAMNDETNFVLKASISANISTIEFTRRGYDRAFHGLSLNGMVGIKPARQAAQGRINQLQKIMLWKQVELGTLMVQDPSRVPYIEEAMKSLSANARRYASDLVTLIDRGEQNLEVLEVQSAVTGGSVTMDSSTPRGGAASTTCSLEGATFVTTVKVRQWFGWGPEHMGQEVYAKEFSLKSPLGKVTLPRLQVEPAAVRCQEKEDSMRKSLAEQAKESQLRELRPQIVAWVDSLRTQTMGPWAADHRKVMMEAANRPGFIQVPIIGDNGRLIPKKICSSVADSDGFYFPSNLGSMPAIVCARRFHIVKSDLSAPSTSESCSGYSKKIEIEKDGTRTVACLDPGTVRM